MAVADLVTMLLPSFHMRVGHLLHERGKIAISLGPNDKMPMVGHQTVSAQPHPASSQRFLNDPLERQEVLVLGEKQSTAHASVEHVEKHPPGECRLGRGRDIHGFLSRYPSFVNLVAVTFHTSAQLCQFGPCHLSHLGNKAEARGHQPVAFLGPLRPSPQYRRGSPRARSGQWATIAPPPSFTAN